jgi:general secretion pathway protein G
MSHRRRAAFTLLEIMIVVVIIGLIATLVIARVMGRSDEAKIKVTKAMMTTVSQQVDLFKLDHGRYPDALEDLVTMPSYVKPEKYPPQGYLKQYPTDGWEAKLIYRRGSGTGKPYELISYGADGREGGEGVDADIVE